MANFTNEVKNIVSIKNPNKSGISTWSDADCNWDDALFSWDSLGQTITNQTKNTASISNLMKS